MSGEKKILLMIKDLLPCWKAIRQEMLIYWEGIYQDY